MNHQTDTELAHEIVNAIERDVNDRRGLGWDSLGINEYEDLKQSLAEIVEGKLNDAGGVGGLHLRLEASRAATVRALTESESNLADAQAAIAKRGELERMNSVKDGRIQVLESALVTAEKRDESVRQVLAANEWVMTNAVWWAIHDAYPEGLCKHCGSYEKPDDASKRSMLEYVIQNEDGEIVRCWPKHHEHDCKLRKLVESYFLAAQQSRRFRES